MKPLLLATFLLLPALPPPPPVPVPGPVAAVAAQSDFMDKVRQAMKIGDRAEIAKLVKTRQAEAVEAIRQICEAIGNSPSEKLENEIAALRKGWDDAHKTDFVDITYEYFSLLRPEFKDDHRKLMARYRVKTNEHVAAEQAKDKAKLKGLGLEFKGFADAFEELGDLYMVSQSHIFYALSFGAANQGEDADLRRECEGWFAVASYRKKIGLEDTYYIQSLERAQTLEHEGYGDPAKGPDARKAKEEAEAVANAISVPLTYELFPDIEAVRRPHYTADSVYQLWSAVPLGGVDSKAGFPTMQQRSPMVIRTAAAKAFVDLDGDGNGDAEIPITGNTETIEITLGEGAEQRKWAFLAKIARERDTYQDFDFNLGPTDDQMSIYVAPASSLVGMIGETPVRVIDDNMDGVYGGGPLEWGYAGLTEGVFQRDMDSVVVGNSDVARPWSELQLIGDQWYRFETKDAGTDLTVTPIDVGETGTLKVKGLKPDWLVVRGKLAKTEKSYFNVVEGGSKGIEVPVGSYELYAGQVSKGKRAQTMKALILPTANTRGWTVQAGETTTIELGEPFDFMFEVEQDDETVKVLPKSIAVVGQSGETYQRIWRDVAAPEILIRRAGTKRGSEEGKLRPAQSQEEVSEHGYDSAWFPWIGEPIEKPKKGETVEVQLFLKKSKLFGKIESSWRQ